MRNYFKIAWAIKLALSTNSPMQKLHYNVVARISKLQKKQAMLNAKEEEFSRNTIILA